MPNSTSSTRIKSFKNKGEDGSSVSLAFVRSSNNGSCNLKSGRKEIRGWSRSSKGSGRSKSLVKSKNSIISTIPIRSKSIRTEAKLDNHKGSKKRSRCSADEDSVYEQNFGDIHSSDTTSIRSVSGLDIPDTREELTDYRSENSWYGADDETHYQCSTEDLNSESTNTDIPRGNTTSTGETRKSAFYSNINKPKPKKTVTFAEDPPVYMSYRKLEEAAKISPFAKFMTLAHRKGKTKHRRPVPRRYT